MDRNSNKYTFIYAVIMVIVVATILTFVAVKLQPFQQKNVEIEKKKNILAAFNVECEPNNVESLYKQIIVEVFAINVDGERLDNVDAFNIDLKVELRKTPVDQQWPVYVAKTQDGDLKYIFPLYGKGLWGPLWGYIAFHEDLNHVFGVYFDHKSETPGLGAEIATSEFQKEFLDKTIFNEKGDFVSIDLIKTGAMGNEHAVDAISGGTITSHGVRDMLKNCLSAYLKFIENNKK